jgi:hypothetical protein
MQSYQQRLLRYTYWYVVFPNILYKFQWIRILLYKKYVFSKLCTVTWVKSTRIEVHVCSKYSLRYFTYLIALYMSRVAQSVWLRTGRPGNRGSIPGRGERIFLLASVSWPALGSINPPVKWVPGFITPELKSGRGVTLTTHLHLVPRSRMSRSYTSSSPKRLHGM